jgi:hypothetical protein
VKRKLLLATLVLLLGAASAAGSRFPAGISAGSEFPAGSNHFGESTMLNLNPTRGGS